VDPPLCGQFRFTLGEYRAALTRHQRHRRPRIRLYLHLVYALFGLFGGVSLWQRGLEDNVLGILSATISAVYFVYWLLVRPARMRAITDRVFAQMSEADQMVRWEFSPDGLKCSAPNARAEFGWNALYEAVGTPEGLLLYPNEHVFHWIPSHAFDQATWKEAVRLVENRVTRFSRCGAA
jgi:hypothetical protein